MSKCPTCGAPTHHSPPDGDLRYLPPVSKPAWNCATRKQSLPDPADCNWPFCGCDLYANKVIEAIEESSYPLLRERTPAEVEARAFFEARLDQLDPVVQRHVRALLGEGK